MSEAEQIIHILAQLRGLRDGHFPGSDIRRGYNKIADLLDVLHSALLVREERGDLLADMSKQPAR